MFSEPDCQKGFYSNSKQIICHVNQVHQLTIAYTYAPKCTCSTGLVSFTGWREILDKCWGVFACLSRPPLQSSPTHLSSTASEKIFADALVGPNNSLQVTDGVTAQIIPHATLGSFLSVTTPKGNKFWFQPPSHSDLRFKGKTINFIDVAGSLILRAEGSTVGVWSLDDTGPSPWRKLVGHAGDVYVSKFFPSGKVRITTNK